jgi:hypothetical protein
VLKWAYQENPQSKLMSLKIFNGTGIKLDFYAESQCYTLTNNETAAKYILFSGQKPILSLSPHKTLQIHQYNPDTPRIANKAQIKMISAMITYGIESPPSGFDVYAVTKEYAMAYKMINGYFPIDKPLATPETLIYNVSGDVLGYLALAVY